MKAILFILAAAVAIEAQTGTGLLKMAGLTDRTETREVTVDGKRYQVQYRIEPNGMVTIPAVGGVSNKPHYDAWIVVHSLGDVYRQVGPEFKGTYVEGGCFEDDPETLVRQALGRQKANIDKIRGYSLNCTGARVDSSGKLLADDDGCSSGGIGVNGKQFPTISAAPIEADLDRLPRLAASTGDGAAVVTNKDENYTFRPAIEWEVPKPGDILLVTPQGTVKKIGHIDIGGAK